MAKQKTNIDRNTPALALSGGGFRATLYHCGAFIRLNELGYLTKFSRISSVSAASIANGMLAAAWPRLKLAMDVALRSYVMREVAAPQTLPLPNHPLG